MKTKFTLIFFLIIQTTLSQSTILDKVQGIISYSGSPISNAKITVLESNETTYSDSSGFYSISAKIGDTLKYSSEGYEDVFIVTEDVSHLLNITMRLRINELDEVILIGKGNSQSARRGFENGQEVDKYFPNIDIKRAAGSNRFIDGNELSNIYSNIEDALVGKVAGFTLYNGKAYLRGGGGSITQDYPVVWDVDGNIFTQSPQVDINNVKAVYFYKSLSSTTIYGTLGVGGVIVVVTKNGPYDNNPEKKKELADLQNKIIYANDASTVLATLRGNSEESKGFENHPEKLKADAYQYQKDESQQEAITYYEDVFNLRAQYAQSYRDLANAYIQGGQYHKAWKLYMSYAFHHNLSKEEGIGEIIYNEMEWLYYNRQAAAKITQRFVPSYSNKKDFERDIRVVFEWNTSEAEFDLEFVNPDKQVYTFEHTLVANEELIQDEKTRGYSSKEFSIPEIDHRDWLVNMTYYGNKKYDPTYFKVTTYYNWGRPNQTQKVKVFKLEETDVKYQLLKYNNNSVRINY